MLQIPDKTTFFRDDMSLWLGGRDDNVAVRDDNVALRAAVAVRDDNVALRAAVAVRQSIY